MKFYIVKVIIRIGEFEKISIKIVRGNTQKEAENNALLSECHSRIGDSAKWDECGISDVSGEFHYSIASETKEIKHEHIDLFYGYLK